MEKKNVLLYGGFIKRLILTIIMIFVVIISITAQTVAVQPVGSGTQANPYQIENLANLRWLSETQNQFAWGTSETNRRFYIQTADIDASETASWNNNRGFNPIGNSTTPFFGIYNGNNYNISNLSINDNLNLGRGGLFGSISNSHILNVRLLNVSIFSSRQYIGALIGYSFRSIIQNCSTTGIISSTHTLTNHYVGGLIGWANGNSVIKYSASYVDITIPSASTSFVGGLIGSLSGVLSNSYFKGSINRGAGLVGEMSSGFIINCYVSTSSVIQNGSAIAQSINLQSGMTNIVFNFWNINTTGVTQAFGSGLQPNHYQANGLNSYQMSQQKSFFGWDFDSVWDINPSINNGSPFLRERLTVFTQTFAIQPVGAGTSSNPYQIATLANLRWLSETANTTAWGSSETNRRFYIQTNDIDASETISWNNNQGFNPIGSTTIPFFGIYDGNGYEIKGLSFISNTSTGGMFNFLRNSQISNLTLTDLMIFSQATRIGSLAGDIRDSIIQNSSTSGLILLSSQHNDFVGGLIGHGSGTSIVNSFSKSKIIVRNHNSLNSGGLGGSLHGNLLNSYFRGWINAGAGLVGSSSGVIKNCYVSTTAPLNSGIALVRTGSPLLFNVYWDIDTTGSQNAFGGSIQPNHSQAMGLTTSQMKQKKSYNNWDFSEIWDINNLINEGYPYLRERIVNSNQTIASQPIGAGTFANPYQIATLANLRSPLRKVKSPINNM